jgi:hypothetical protein
MHRNMFRGPGHQNVDMSLAKSFELSGKLSLQLRGEFFNIFKHTNCGASVLTWEASLPAFRRRRRMSPSPTQWLVPAAGGTFSSARSLFSNSCPEGKPAAPASAGAFTSLCRRCSKCIKVRVSLYRAPY